jgi:hypothetical protein
MAELNRLVKVSEAHVAGPLYAELGRLAAAEFAATDGCGRGGR